jgi:hypothetical protein
MALRRIIAFISILNTHPMLQIIDKVYLPLIISILLFIGMFGVVVSSCYYTKLLEQKNKEIEDIKERFDI